MAVVGTARTSSANSGATTRTNPRPIPTRLYRKGNGQEAKLSYPKACRRPLIVEVNEQFVGDKRKCGGPI